MRPDKGTVLSDPPALRRLRRGVLDPQRSAEFYAWLLDVPARRRGREFVIECGNGELIFSSEVTMPIAIDACADSPFLGRDPDGVPVTFSDATPRHTPGPLMLDHVALTCADLGAAIRFYRSLGCVITWSASNTGARFGIQEEPVVGARFAHVSGSDGYLALAQADSGEGEGSSGRPRLLHLGLSVASLRPIRERLARKDVDYRDAPADAVGDRLYVRDPDGDPNLGENVELTEYAQGIPRSGQLVELLTAASRE